MVILCHYTLSLQPLSPPPSEVCSDVFMCTEYIKKKSSIHYKTDFLLCPVLRWQLFQGGLASTSVASWADTIFFALLIFPLDTLHTYIQLFQAWAFVILFSFFPRISRIPLPSHTSFSFSCLTSWYHLCSPCPFKRLQFLIIALSRKLAVV